MLGRYRRSVSFPDPDPSRPSKLPAAGKAYHVRSTSLPCGRSHPLIPQLKDEINELRSWQLYKPTTTSINSSWLLNGLTRLKSVLESLDDLIQMPLTHESLSQRPHLVNKLLEDFLHFVDVFGIFQTSMLALKQELSAAQVAIRRKDDSKLTTCVKSQKKISKETAKLVSAVRSIECPAAAALEINAGLDEIPSVIRDVRQLTVSVSAALFEGVMRSLGPTRRSMSDFQQGTGGVLESLWGLMKKNSTLKGLDEEKRTGMLNKMQEMEECVSGMENGSERVFRSLISTRVSLLNVLTHA